MLITESYKNLSDKELVSLIVNNNNEAAIYLLYHKCYKPLCSIVISLFETSYYIDEMISELYVLLKGKDDTKEPWATLKSYSGKANYENCDGEAKLSTWMYRVATNLFIEKRRLLIDFSQKTVQLENGNLKPMDNTPTVEERMLYLALYDAISRLENPVYKLVLMMELQGYKPREITEELNKRLKCKNISIILKEGKECIDEAYVYTAKQRALAIVSKVLKKSTNER